MNKNNHEPADIDEVIERIRAEAQAETETHDTVAEPGGRRHQLRRSPWLRRLAGAVRYRLLTPLKRVKGRLRRPVSTLRDADWRPATNRAMTGTVTRLEGVERALDDLETGLGRNPHGMAEWAMDPELEGEGVVEQIERQASRQNAVEAALERHEARHAKRLSALEQAIAQIRLDITSRFHGLNRLVDELEALRDGAARNAGADSAAGEAVQPLAASDSTLDAFYLAFENACRGDEADIAAQLRTDYLETVQAALARTDAGGVLDIGCGRGEWLKVLAAAGIEASGVDLSPVMAEHCRAQGLDVVAGDALAALADRPAESLTVVSGFHIIEHLPFAVLYRVFEEVARVLRPGGLCIFETPNPENLLVGSHTFYHDATHSNPLTPTATGFLAEYHGLHPVEIRRLHPYPAAAKVPGSDPLTERVNGHLCGPQDYALIGEKPGA
jgi:SAM-dependent methyltransferase